MSQLIIFCLALTIIIPFGIFLKGERRLSRFKASLAVNIVSFFFVLVLGTVLVYTGTVSAEAAGEAAGGAGSASGLAFLAAGLSTGLSCVGAGIAISSAASSAIGALSENEALMGKALIFVALAEGVAIYGLIISIMILGRV